jgi:superfamily II DNA/RNA helicase
VYSYWASGNPEMQEKLKVLLEKEEPIQAKPVFQSTFPWETSEKTMGEQKFFNEKFKNALNNVDEISEYKEYKFSRDRKVFTHQEKCWEILCDKKNVQSAIVTSGTGSGKTECFLMPIMNDLYEQKINDNYKTGIQALFLYPLNALINSQIKRVAAWSNELNPCVTFAKYNGNTPEDPAEARSKGIMPIGKGELTNRKNIREAPPQILFTNSTMLEYMLVRNKDRNILKESQGKLRWVVIDEAHTYSGSAAAELSLLIKRILLAFGVDAKDVRFVATSATIGGDENSENSLKKFMSQISGQRESQIKVISGRRILPHIPGISQEIQELRKKVNRAKSVSLENLGGFDKILELTDKKDYLSLRGHYHIRAIQGLFQCVNPECGKLTTRIHKNCPYCEYPLLEVVSCNVCAAHFLYGESNNHVIRQTTIANEDMLELNEYENGDDETETEKQGEFKPIYYVPKDKIPLSELTENVVPIKFSKDGKIEEEGNFIEIEKCCICGKSVKNAKHLRVGNNFYVQNLAYLLLEQAPPKLEQAPPKELNSTELSWDGRKLLTFTDNRQGTAKMSLKLNYEAQRNWIRTKVYDILLKNNKLTTEEQGQLKELQSLGNAYPALQERKQELIAKQKNGAPIKFVEMKERLETVLPNMLYEHNTEGKSSDVRKIDYIEALLFDQFARRPKMSNSMETLGLVKLVYPKLREQNYPQIAKDNNISEQDWQDFLKICVDYHVRRNYHLYVPSEILSLIMQTFNNKEMKWPEFKWQANKFEKRQNRLCILLCAGLGYHNTSEIDATKKDIVNSLLNYAKTAILNILGEKQQLIFGEQTDMKKQVEFELINQAYLCPITKKPLDTIFKGYSPWITGNITPSNIKKFKIIEQVISSENNYSDYKKYGIWGNIHEKILANGPTFLSSEHSAQISADNLKKFEKKFEDGKINILNCSTTMEMGVDIGGVSIVLQNNVPPYPANYLQRAGRAGRRNESRSLVITICGAEPIGERAFDTPNWAMSEAVDLPRISFESEVLVQRHINSYLFGNFVCERNEGMQINEKIKTFFFNENNPEVPCEEFQNWLVKLINESDRLLSGFETIVRGTCLSKESFENSIKKCKTMIEDVDKRIKERKEFDEKNITELKTNGYDEESRAVKDIKYGLKNLLDGNIIGYLAEQRFLPNAGIPTGVCDMNLATLTDIRNNNKIDKPSRDLIKGIYEFAPGNELVVNNWVYKSGGIILNTSLQQGNLDLLKICRNCGYSWLNRENLHEEFNECPECHKNDLTGIDIHKPEFTKIIEPAGFSVDLYSKKTKRLIEKNISKYTNPILLSMEPWQPQSEIFLLRTGSEAEILYVNLGSETGFDICLKCGRTESSNLATPMSDEHLRLRGGRESDGDNNGICGGTIRRNVALAGRFRTSVVEFSVWNAENHKYSDNEQLICSLAVAIKQVFVRKLGIDNDEISFGFRHNRIENETFWSTFFFDTAKGGSGYSQQLPWHLISLLKDVKNLCECKNCQEACCKCLITRESKWFLDKLNRHKVIDWYDRIEHLLDSKRSPYSLIDSILNFGRSNLTTKIRLFMDSNLSQWNDIYSVIEDLYYKRKSLEVISVDYVPFQDEYENFKRINNVKQWAEFTKLATTQIPKEYDGILLAQVMRDNKRITWYSKDEKLYWLTEDSNAENPIGTPIELPKLINVNNYYNAKSIDFLLESTKISEFGKFIIGHINKDNLLVNLKCQEIKIVYSDRCFRSPFDAILLAELLYGIKQNFQCSIKEIKVRCNGIREKSYFGNNLIESNFIDDKNRRIFIKDLFNQKFKLETKIEEIQSIEHYRDLVLSFAGKKITINADGGMNNGWKIKDRVALTSNSSLKELLQYCNKNEITIVPKHEQIKIRYTVIM